MSILTAWYQHIAECGNCTCLGIVLQPCVHFKEKDSAVFTNANVQQILLPEDSLSSGKRS